VSENFNQNFHFQTSNLKAPKLRGGGQTELVAKKQASSASKHEEDISATQSQLSLSLLSSARNNCEEVAAKTQKVVVHSFTKKLSNLQMDNIPNMAQPDTYVDREDLDHARNHPCRPHKV